MATRKTTRAARAATMSRSRTEIRGAGTVRDRTSIRRGAPDEPLRDLSRTQRLLEAKVRQLEARVKRLTASASAAATKQGPAVGPRYASPDFLKGLGLNVAPAELEDLVASAVLTLPTTLASGDPSGEISDSEREALTRGGFDPATQSSGGQDPLARTVAEFAALIRTSRTVAELAKILRVNESRIRQRLGERSKSLYGFKVDGAWRIPEFVLDGTRLVPGIDKVAARLDPELHPVAFFRWFTTAHTDLVGGEAAAEEIGEERPLAPRSWLLAGFDPEAVARLASEL